MKSLEINIPLTLKRNFLNFPGNYEINNLRITTDNFTDLRDLVLIVKIFYNDKIIFEKLVQPNDKDFRISEMSFISTLLANRLTIESKRNLDFSVIGLINF